MRHVTPIGAQGEENHGEKFAGGVHATPAANAIRTTTTTIRATAILTEDATTDPTILDHVITIGAQNKNIHGVLFARGVIATAAANAITITTMAEATTIMAIAATIATRIRSVANTTTVTMDSARDTVDTTRTTEDTTTVDAITNK